MALEHQSNPNSSLPIEDAFAEFFLYQRSMRHSERTLEFYRHTLGKFRRWMEANNVSDVAQVEPAAVRRFALELADSGLADSTVHAYMRAVRAFFRFLEREELVERTPMRNVRMPKVEKKILPAFTDAEVEKLLAASEGQDFRNLRNRLLVLLLLDSGLRLAECANLAIGDIHPETGAMKVMGKGKKERVTRIGARCLRLYRKYLRLRGGEEGEPLWLGKRGPMKRLGIAETLEKLGKRAGVHAHPHKFRRTCALRLLKAGADVFSVQLLLGHSDLAVLRRYLDQTPEDVLAVHARVVS
jgi:site-specific recombinase XerD